MKPTEFLGQEVIRPLVTLVIPGSIAHYPWVVCVDPKFDPLRSEVHVSAAGLLFGLSVAVGVLLDDLGSRIEHRWDKCIAKKRRKHFTEWYDYLALTFTPEPVGHRYLRTLTFKLKFELNMTVALAAFAAGRVLTEASTWLECALLLAGALWLLYESWTTSNVLHKLRRELLKRLKGTEKQA